MIWSRGSKVKDTGSMTDAEKAESGRHAGHRAIDVSAVDDSRRKLHCVDCNATYDAGELDFHLRAFQRVILDK
jgi:hypothetical protein